MTSNCLVLLAHVLLLFASFSGEYAHAVCYMLAPWDSKQLTPSRIAAGCDVLPPPDQILIVQSGFSPVIDGLDSLADLSMMYTMRYCNIHGYQYRRYVVQAAQKDRFYGWHKPALWAKLLTEFSVVVAIDFDVIFQDLTLSLESMLSRWGFTAHTLVMQPYDPEQDFNYVTKPDGERVLSVNIGFSVLRSSRKVIDLLHQWSRCTIDIKACKQYKGLHLDQDTWSMYFKPKLTDLEFVAAPCNEANGHTQSEGLEHFNDGCNGTLVAHHWTAPPGVLPHLRQLVWKAYVTDVPRRVIPITL